MTIKRFMYLNLRKRMYNKNQRDWLLQKAVSCLGQEEVLEVHSFAPVSGHGRPELPAGLSCVTFRDGANHLVSQVYSNDTHNGLRAKKEVPFFIDGRCIDGDKIARPAMHLIHKLDAFTPSIDRLVVWTHNVPRRLFELLDDDQVNCYVDEVRGLGLVITIPAGEIRSELQIRKLAL